MQDRKPSTRMERQLERIIAAMERVNLEEYLRYVDDRRRQFAVNFTAGLARGLGAANIPGIGGFLADVVRMVLDRI